MSTASLLGASVVRDGVNSTLNGEFWTTVLQPVRSGDKGVANTEVRIPFGQKNRWDFIPIVQSIGLSTLSSSILMNTSGSVKATITRGSFGKMTNLVLEFIITVATANVVPVPLTDFFSRMDFIQVAGDLILFTLYDDTQKSDIAIMANQGQFESLFGEVGIASDTAGYLGTIFPLVSGNQYTYHLPINAGPINDKLQLYWQNAKSDLWIRFYSAAGGTVIASGSGTLSCTVNLLSQSQDLEPEDIRLHGIADSNLVFTNRFVDPVNVGSIGQYTLTAGKTTKVDISQLGDQLISDMLLIVRPSGGGTNVNNGNWLMMNLGDNNGATLDVVDPTSNSVFGAPISTRFLRTEYYTDHTDNNFCTLNRKAMYYLPFCNSMRHARKGAMDGWLYINSDRWTLNITPAQRTQEIQLVTASNATNVSGFYQLGWRGSKTIALAYNATGTTVGNALNTMRSFASKNITCGTVTGSLVNSVSPLTIPLVHPETDGLMGETLEVYPNVILNSGAVPDTPVPSIGTRGVAGIPSGGPVSVDIYVWCSVYTLLSYFNGKFNRRVITP
jgi:hypothetical protein